MPPAKACNSRGVLTVREISLSDADAVAELTGQLGYPVSADVMKSRIRAMESVTDHVIYVACDSDLVVGWIDVGLTFHLQAEPYAEIGGLVVSEAFRSSGIGRELLAKAEQWARSRGLKNMLVRSRIAREAAHRFYRREGYEQTKTSAVFSKSLS